MADVNIKDLGDVTGPRGKKGDKGSDGILGTQMFPVKASITSVSQLPSGIHVNDLVLNATSVPLVIGNLDPVAAGELCRLTSIENLTFTAEGNIRGPAVITRIVPDYNNIETTPKIALAPPTNTDASGSWTVDKDGFISIVYTTNTSNIGSNAYVTIAVYINEQRVAYIFSTPNNGSMTGQQIVPIAVSKNNTIKLNIRYNDGLTGSAYCYFLPPKAVEIGYNIPLTQVNPLLTIGPPDYANMETTNRITTSGGTWKVDRDGYVRCALNFSTFTTSAGGFAVFINNKQIVSIPISTGMGYNYNIMLPVKKDDIVTLNNNGIGGGTPTYSCYFIPPVLNPPTYLEAHPMVNYSFVEQETGRTDVNGKIIYQKTINFTSAGIASNTSETIGDFTTILPSASDVVDNLVVSQTSSGQQPRKILSAYRTNTQLILYNYGAVSFSAVKYLITLWYIK